MAWVDRQQPSQHFQYPTNSSLYDGEQEHHAVSKEVSLRSSILWSAMFIFLIFQLETIQNHIRLTKEHINALEGRFASYQNPPGIFISEHEEWTQKLHNFIEVREV